jgi:hypothetical protein
LLLLHSRNVVRPDLKYLFCSINSTNQGFRVGITIVATPCAEISSQQLWHVRCTITNRKTKRQGGKHDELIGSEGRHSKVPSP